MIIHHERGSRMRDQILIVALFLIEMALSAPASLMPKINGINDGNGWASIMADIGAHHYRLIGLEVTLDPSYTVQYLGLIQLGSSRDAVLANQPHHIVIDRCYAHALPTINV